MAADISVEETVQKVSSLTENILSELFSKWEKMYKIDDEFKKRSLETFIYHVEDLYENMIAAEAMKLTELTEEVELKLSETVELEKELGVIISKVNTDLPLKHLVTELDNAMEEFRKMKETKLQHFETLVQKERELCSFLGKEPKAHSDQFPKEKDFEDLELYLFELSQEKIERNEYWNETKSRIAQLITKLGLVPQTPFERNLLSNDVPDSLNDSDIIKLKELESSLIEKVDVANNNKIFKLDKLKKLWAKLKIPEDDQLEFLNTIGEGLSGTEFLKIDEEFSRCEALKLENIKPLILSSKQKLEDLWDKLQYSEKQRKEFSPFFSPFFNEDVLELLEIQVEKLTAYYEENMYIFELVEKWNHLWERMIHLDELSKNKNRLFDNRGGQLLKEEKERKAVENNLPKVYSELEKALVQYTEKTGSVFLWNGQNLLEKLKEDWLQRELAMKKKNVNKGISSPVESNQRSAQKRKLPYTPTSARKCKTPSSIKSKSRPITPVSPSDLSSTSIASYSVFQEHIESRCKTPRRLDDGHTGLISANTPLGPPHSSPTFTPLRKLRNTPSRNAVTPLRLMNTRSASKIATPVSTSRLATPLSTSRAVTPGSTMKNSSNRKGTPKTTPTPLSKSRFTPARRFNLFI